MIGDIFWLGTGTNKIGQRRFCRISHLQVQNQLVELQVLLKQMMFTISNFSTYTLICRYMLSLRQLLFIQAIIMTAFVCIYIYIYICCHCQFHAYKMFIECFDYILQRMLHPYHQTALGGREVVEDVVCKLQINY